MVYQELHRRYGTNVAVRVQLELTEAEFEEIDIDFLPTWLERRAEQAHENYRRLQNNPSFAVQGSATAIGEACRRWRESEDLAYLVAIAEDVSLNARIL